MSQSKNRFSVQGSSSRSPRFSVNLKCEAVETDVLQNSDQKTHFQIKNISRSGLCLSLQQDQKEQKLNKMTGNQMMLKVWLDSSIEVDLKLEEVWEAQTDSGQTIGYKITSESSHWNQFIDQMEERISIEL